METTDTYQQETTRPVTSAPVQPVQVHLSSLAPHQSYPKGLVRLTSVLVFYALLTLMYQFPPMDLLRSFSGLLSVFTGPTQPVTTYSGFQGSTNALPARDYMYHPKSAHTRQKSKQSTLNQSQLLDTLPVSPVLPFGPMTTGDLIDNTTDNPTSGPETLSLPVPRPELQLK